VKCPVTGRSSFQMRADRTRAASSATRCRGANPAVAAPIILFLVGHLPRTRGSSVVSEGNHRERGDFAHHAQRQRIVREGTVLLPP
jgi:hypothetical protein